MSAEQGSIRAAFKKITQNEGKDIKIRLTVIIVQSNSNYRIFPADRAICGSDAERSDSRYEGRDQSRGRNSRDYGQDSRDSVRGRYGQDDRYGGANMGRRDDYGDRYGYGGRPGGYDSGRYGNSGSDRYGGGNRFGGGRGGGRGGFAGARGGGGGNAAAQNVPPGTCVDSDVVHPSHTEFLLVAHKSIMVRQFFLFFDSH